MVSRLEASWEYIRASDGVWWLSTLFALLEAIDRHVTHQFDSDIQNTIICHEWD
jgi:hypothetical protein